MTRARLLWGLAYVLFVLVLCGLVYWLFEGHRESERAPLEYPSAHLVATDE